MTSEAAWGAAANLGTTVGTHSEFLCVSRETTASEAADTHSVSTATAPSSVRTLRRRRNRRGKAGSQPSIGLV